MKKLESLFTADEAVKWYNYGKQYRHSSKKRWRG
jgi:hypothetical protein